MGGHSNVTGKFGAEARRVVRRRRHGTKVGLPGVATGVMVVAAP
jgi:hypothetical protein